LKIKRGERINPNHVPHKGPVKLRKEGGGGRARSIVTFKPYTRRNREVQMAKAKSQGTWERFWTKIVRTGKGEGRKEKKDLKRWLPV